MPPKLPLPHKRVRVIARQLSGKNCLAAIFASRHQDASPGPLGFRRFPIFDRKRCSKPYSLSLSFSCWVLGVWCASIYMGFACSFARVFPYVLLPFCTSPGCEQPLGRGSGTVGKCTGPKCIASKMVQTYSEPALSFHRTKMDQMVHFDQKKSILVHLDPPTVLRPDNPYPLN